MKVFVAGASGTIGSRLVPQLVANGHEVVGTHGSPGNAEHVRALGAEPVELDLLDAGAVRGPSSKPRPTRSSIRRPLWPTCASRRTSTAPSP